MAVGLVVGYPFRATFRNFHFSDYFSIPCYLKNDISLSDFHFWCSDDNFMRCHCGSLLLCLNSDVLEMYQIYPAPLFDKTMPRKKFSRDRFRFALRGAVTELHALEVAC